MKNFKFIDLFCGIGGFHQALSDLGGECVYASDIDADCRKTYEELKAKGVEFIQPPEDRPYGVEALMRDNSGNWMVLVEPKVP